jgi:hypothetical protein
MYRRSVILCIAIASLAPAALCAKERLWQEGELVSKRTVPADRRDVRNRYIYRIRAGTARYLVALEQPLALDFLVPMRFSLGRHHVLIQDADGAEKRAILVQNPPRNSAHR